MPGPLVWGARTVAPTTATEWRYVNVRRLLLFVEESIAKGLDWVVFEPNGPSLWKKLQPIITEFLTRLWGQRRPPGSHGGRRVLRED